MYYCMDLIMESYSANPGARPRGYSRKGAGEVGIWKPVSAKLGRETFIDRKLELIPIDPRKKLEVNFISKHKVHGQTGGAVFHVAPQTGKYHLHHKEDSRPKKKSGFQTEDRTVKKLDVKNIGSEFGGVAGRCVKSDACLNVRVLLTAEIGQETFTDRRMEFIDVHLHKICVESSKTKAKSHLSGGRIPFNEESIGNRNLNRIDAHPQHADVEKGSVTEDRKSAACDVSVRAGAPGMYSEKEKYTTLRTGGQNTSKQQNREEPKAKQYLSEGRMPLNRESVGNTTLRPNDPQSGNTDVQKLCDTGDRKHVACDVRVSGPDLCRESGKYTTTKIIGGQNIRGQLTAQLGNETFIDRVMFFTRVIPPQKIRRGGFVPFEVTTQGDSGDSAHNSQCVRVGAPGIYGEKERYTTLRTGGQNTRKQLTAQTGDETKTKENMSGSRMRLNRESAGITVLRANDSPSEHADVKKGSVTGACVVGASGPRLCREKGNYTTSKIIAGQNIIGQLRARLGDETFIDRMMIFLPVNPPTEDTTGRCCPV